MPECRVQAPGLFVVNGGLPRTINRRISFAQTAFLIGRAEQMGTLIANVGSARQPAFPDLALQRQVPKRDGWQAKVLIEDLIKRDWTIGERRIAADFLIEATEVRREWIR